MQAFYFFNFFKQRLCIFSQKLSNENKQRLYKIRKRPTSLFYHVMLIKQNECTRQGGTESEMCRNNKKKNSLDFVVILYL